MTQLAFQILVTFLLSLLTAIGAWALKSIIKQREDADQRHLELVQSLSERHTDLTTRITEISQQIWGRDGRNGHTADLKDLKRGLQRIFDVLSDYDHRIRRVEEKVGIDTPAREHPRIRRREGTDDAEDDRSA